MEDYEYLLPDRAYQALKWAALIACPALATFAATVLPAWGLPHADQLVTTINAVGLLIGTLIGVSATTAKPTGQQTQELQIPRHMRAAHQDNS